MGFSRQAYWSGLPFPSPGDLSDPEIEPRSPALQADSLPMRETHLPLLTTSSPFLPLQYIHSEYFFWFSLTYYSRSVVCKLASQRTSSKVMFHSLHLYLVTMFFLFELLELMVCLFCSIHCSS